MAIDKPQKPTGPSKLEQIRALSGGMPGIARQFVRDLKSPRPIKAAPGKIIRKTGRGR
jgi:hypothetical protein